MGVLCRAVLRRPDLVDDPRFRTNTDRVDNNDELTPILEDVFRDLTAEDVEMAGREPAMGPVPALGQYNESIRAEFASRKEIPA